MLWLPESPKWLLAQGRFNELRDVMAKIAFVNGHELNFAEFMTRLDVLDRAKKSAKSGSGATDEQQNSLMYYLRQKRILQNLAIMAVVWLATSFNYYLIMYLVNTFDRVYQSGIMSSMSEILAILVSGIIYRHVGIRGSISLAFGLALLGGAIIIFYGLQHESSWVFLLLVLAAKFGIAASFNIVYISNSEIFPVLFAASALGYCNLFSRVLSAVSPFMASMHEPTPMIVFTTLSLVTMALVWGLNTDETGPPTLTGKGEKTDKSEKKRVD